MNADEGGRPIRSLVETFVERHRHARLFTNLPPESWFGLLHAARLIIGNSSSVVMESPSIPLPAVCVGERQAGRERAWNVLDAHPSADAITTAISTVLARPLGDVESPYGDGHASERMLEVIRQAPQRHMLLQKRTTILVEQDAVQTR